MSLPKRTGTPRLAVQPTARVHLGETRWFGEIVRFLERHPRSSLLALVLAVSPDFLGLPPDARAQLWFWMKAELQSLARMGVFSTAIDPDEITTYSLRPGRSFNTDGPDKREAA
jgi:hypothetical protein